MTQPEKWFSFSVKYTRGEATELEDSYLELLYHSLPACTNKVPLTETPTVVVLRCLTGSSALTGLHGPSLASH